MAKDRRRSSLGSQGDPGRENTSNHLPLDEENLRREDNEYGDDIFEIEDQSPSRPSTSDGGLGRREKDAHGVSKEAASDTDELQVHIRT